MKNSFDSTILGVFTRSTTTRNCVEILPDPLGYLLIALGCFKLQESIQLLKELEFYQQ